MARTRAAKPAAEDAKPAAVGKLFADTRRRVIVESFGAEVSLDSISPRSRRRFLRHACVLVEDCMSSSSPLSMRVSGPEYDPEHDAVVRVRKDFWDKVTEREEFVGRFRETSRLPQYLWSINRCFLTKLRLGIVLRHTYLITAMLTGAVVLARYTSFSPLLDIVKRSSPE